jgi:transcriptional regulator with XRE-family HTH domain
MEELSFGHFLRKAREEVGISSRKLSGMVNKTPTYVSQIERGEIKKPDVQITTKIFEALGFENEKISSLLSSFKIDENHVKKKNQVIKYDNESFNKKLNDIYILDSVREKQHWFNDREIETLNDTNHEVLSFFIKRDYSKAQTVINNLHLLLNSEKEDFNFFCELFENNFQRLSSNTKKEVLTTIKEIVEKSKGENME